MTVRSTWAVIESNITHGIIFIEDICDKTGCMSITNDAENVLEYFRETVGLRWRVVYKDTDQEWWEIVRDTGPYDTPTGVHFKQWNGLAWDILSRKD